MIFFLVTVFDYPRLNFLMEFEFIFCVFSTCFEGILLSVATDKEIAWTATIIIMYLSRC